MDIHAPIFVAGHRGLVGSALLRRLEREGADNLVLRTRSELDLTNQAATDAFFARERPAYVLLAAAKVGGIHANATYPADFIYENQMIQANVLQAAWRHGTRKLLFLGSSCIYPRQCPQPIREEYLLSGPLEATNEAYAIAKIAGIKMCDAYRTQYGFDCVSAMPTNLYGPGDDFTSENSHVVPALLRRFVHAHEQGDAQVVIWGTGTPMREFLHVDDLADALVHLMRIDSAALPDALVNIGSGEEISIADLARLIADVVGYRGAIVFDSTRPDGTPRKLLDSSLIRSTGWRPRVLLRRGLELTLEALLAGRMQEAAARGGGATAGAGRAPG